MGQVFLAFLNFNNQPFDEKNQTCAKWSSAMCYLNLVPNFPPQRELGCKSMEIMNPSPCGNSNYTLQLYQSNYEQDFEIFGIIILVSIKNNHELNMSSWTLMMKSKKPLRFVWGSNPQSLNPNESRCFIHCTKATSQMLQGLNLIVIHPKGHFNILRSLIKSHVI